MVRLSLRNGGRPEEAPGLCSNGTTIHRRGIRQEEGYGLMGKVEGSVYWDARPGCL